MKFSIAGFTILVIVVVLMSLTSTCQRTFPHSLSFSNVINDCRGSNFVVVIVVTGLTCKPPLAGVLYDTACRGAAPTSQQWCMILCCLEAKRCLFGPAIGLHKASLVVFTDVSFLTAETLDAKLCILPWRTQHNGAGCLEFVERCVCHN